jgi:hypothetical protein
MLHGKPGGYKKSAHLNDGKDIGVDLAGGFYDAGGKHAKQCSGSGFSEAGQSRLLGVKTMAHWRAAMLVSVLYMPCDCKAVGPCMTQRATSWQS